MESQSYSVWRRIRIISNTVRCLKLHVCRFQAISRVPNASTTHRNEEGNRIGMERQDGWERSRQRPSVRSCFVSSRYKFDRKVPRGGRCHGKGKFSRRFTSDRCATMRLVQHVLGSSIPMFVNMAILFYVLRRVSYHKTNYLVASAAGAEKSRVTTIV